MSPGEQRAQLASVGVVADPCDACREPSCFTCEEHPAYRELRELRDRMSAVIATMRVRSAELHRLLGVITAPLRLESEAWMISARPRSSIWRAISAWTFPAIS